MSRLWPPAAAISSARFVTLAADVGQVCAPEPVRPDPARPAWRVPAASARGEGPRAARATGWRSPRCPRRGRPRSVRLGHEQAPVARSPAPSAAFSAPLTGRSSPLSAPLQARSPRALSAGSSPLATSSPTAIARSKPGPALRTCAGARFTVRRFCGKSRPELRRAARTRSRDSRIARSGSPTSVKVEASAVVHLDGHLLGRTPSSVNVATAASTGPP